MPTEMVTLLMLGFILFIAVPLVAFLGIRSATAVVRGQKKRMAELLPVAKAIDAQYLAEDRSVVSHLLSPPFFPQSSSEEETPPQAIGVMRTLVAARTPAIFFDMIAYVTAIEGSGIYFMTVAMFELQCREIPAFQLEKKKIDPAADRSCASRGNRFGPAIELNARPGFTKIFRLHGSDETAINRIFQQPLCQFIEAHDGWSIGLSSAPHPGWLCAASSIAPPSNNIPRSLQRLPRCGPRSPTRMRGPVEARHGATVFRSQLDWD